MNQSKEKTKNLWLFVSDMASIFISYLLAGVLWMLTYMRINNREMLIYILKHDLAVVLLSYVIVVFLAGSGVGFTQRTAIDELIEVFRKNLLFAALLSVFLFFKKSTTLLPRGIYLLVIVLNVLFMFIFHCILRSYLMKYRRNSRETSKVLVVTVRDRVDGIVRNIRQNREWHSKVEGIILIDDDITGEKVQNVPVVASYDNMFEYLRREIVDEVFISVPYETGTSVREAVTKMEDMGIVVHLEIDKLQGFDEFNKELGMFGSIPVVTFANVFHNENQLLLKRFMDIIGALVGLVITAAVTVFLAPVLLIESPGNLFFHQKRVGINGRYFMMHKFRSMYSDAEERKKELMDKNEMSGLMFKMTDDPRITKVGRFIRKTSIDELPQFFNVLKGDMSLVGTRPPTVDEFKQYEGHHKRRLSMKPGITGLWQVSGRSDIEDFEEVVRLDLEYIDNWSIWLDIKILIKTVGVIFTNKGAK